MKKHIVSFLLLSTFFAVGLTVASCEGDPTSSGSVAQLPMKASPHSCRNGQVWSRDLKTCIPKCPIGYCYAAVSFQNSDDGSTTYYDCIPKDLAGTSGILSYGQCIH